MTSLLSCALRCGSRPYDGAICRRLGPGHNQQGAGLTFISLQIRVSYIHITYPYPMTMKFIEASKPNSHAFDSIKQKHNILQEISNQIVCINCSVCARLLGLLLLSAPFHLRHYIAIIRQQYHHHNSLNTTNMSFCRSFIWDTIPS